MRVNVNKKERSFGLKVRRIDMGIFDYPVYCAIGNYKKFSKYIQWKFDDKNIKIDEQAPRGQTWIRTGYVPVIWLPRTPKTPRELSTVAHESYHAACCLFRWASVPITDDTDEVVGHTIGHIVNEILKR